MVAGSESHFWVYDNVITAFGNVFVERAVDDTLVINHDRLKVVFLPFLVPVLALYKFPADCKRGLHREISQKGINFSVVKKFGLYICGQSGFIRHKTFKPCLGKQGGKNIGTGLVTRGCIETQFYVIVHFRVFFVYSVCLL